MAVDKKFKLSLPRLFRFPFLSCRQRNAVDIAEAPTFVSHRSELGDQKPPHDSFHLPTNLLPVLCKPRLSQEVKEAIVQYAKRLSGRRIGRAKTCPPAPPTSPLPLPIIKSTEIIGDKSGETNNMKRKKHVWESKPSSGDSYGFSSNDDHFQFEQAKEADHDMFSSSSSESYHLKLAKSRRRRAKPKKLGRSFTREDEFGDDLLVGEKEQSVAVVKRSSDPYADFRISMVEMIIDKQIFAARELEKLLDCFLALNAPYHHRVIVQVFEEICEALFSDWS